MAYFWKPIAIMFLCIIIALHKLIYYILPNYLYFSFLHVIYCSLKLKKKGVTVMVKMSMGKPTIATQNISCYGCAACATGIACLASVALIGLLAGLSCANG